jgi:hypothetical protein
MRKELIEQILGHSGELLRLVLDEVDGRRPKEETGRDRKPLTTTACAGESLARPLAADVTGQRASLCVVAVFIRIEYLSDAAASRAPKG